MRIRSCLIVAIFLFSCSGPLWAGPEGKAIATSIYNDGGNRANPISFTFNTSTPILVSSAAWLWRDPAISSNTKTFSIQVWRGREIINCSNGRMMLVDDPALKNVFSDTYSVVLGSDTSNISGNFHGDSYIVPGQGPVWAIWGSETTSGGACGSENYWDPKRGATVKP